MKFNINIIVNGDYLTTFYNVEANSEAEAIELAEERLVIDFEVEADE